MADTSKTGGSRGFSLEQAIAWIQEGYAVGNHEELPREEKRLEENPGVFNDEEFQQLLRLRWDFQFGRN